FHKEDGRTGGREARIFGWRCRQRVCGAIASSTPPASSREIFLVLVLQKQKCVLASRTSRPPVLPVKSRRASKRVLSATAARSARAGWPCAATVVSARKLRFGSQRCAVSTGGHGHGETRGSAQISICEPISITRLGGMPKNAVAGWALRVKNANSPSRHSAMPGSLVGSTVSRPKKKVVYSSE